MVRRRAPPELLEPVWAGRVVPPVGVPEAPERLVAGFVITGLRVDLAERFQRRVQVTTDDVRRTPRGTGWYFCLSKIENLAEVWHVAGWGESKEWWPGTGLFLLAELILGKLLILTADKRAQNGGNALSEYVISTRNLRPIFRMKPRRLTGCYACCVPNPKTYSAENNYDTSVECTNCGAAIHENTLVFVSKDKVRCPRCNAIFTPKPSDIR